MRPLAKQLAGKESFHPELMAGFYVVRSIADIFAEDQKGYAFKQATLDPILPENKSDAQETEVINYFQANRKTKIQKGMMNKNGREFFYVARPVVNKAACNRCHGRREDAPKEQLAKYPNYGGYNWRVDDVVATMITYVPIDATIARMKTTAMKTITAGLASVALLMLVTWYFMSKLVVKPLIRLTELAGDMSRGRGLDQEITGDRNDEIGALCDSFNRMRKSVVNLIKIVNQKGA
jgi:protein-histidine pros-kinase